MSSLNRFATCRATVRVAIVIGLALGLSACLRPLYGPTASGQSLQNVLASIDVPELKWTDAQARIGHFIRSELVYDLNGSGSDTPKQFVLNLTFDETLSTPIVDSVSGRAQSATLIGNLTFTLTNKDGTKVITQGRATGQATYDRFKQRFATVRAARDAEIRLAKSLAEQIKTRLAATLSQM
ncbi:LPS assembly lipoprotein LptE [Microvirga antarctica]|uniref:LPS assembly lipoprotein LptE n=1 Tax=Microvirga antarctica TaxID=2819233 RepID=UPI001B317915|nr:LPS assembly lipoprotein LptE [Microvirga antarctica]